MDLINQLLMRVMDGLLGWLLVLPKDAAIALVALATAGGLAMVRKWTTNQDLLRRCAADKQRLKVLIKEAKQRRDAAAVQRHQTVKGLVATLQLKAEGKPLLVSLLPIALLATWCFQRLEFHPPRAGAPVKLNAHFPASAAGRLVHLVPADHFQAATGWIQEITVVTNDGPAHGLASWELRPEAGAQTATFHLRYAGRSYDHPVRVGQRTYAPPVVFHDEQMLCSEVPLPPVKLLGIVPAFLGLPAWLTGYLVVVVVLLPAIKRLLRVH